MNAPVTTALPTEATVRTHRVTLRTAAMCALCIVTPVTVSAQQKGGPASARSTTPEIIAPAPVRATPNSLGRIAGAWSLPEPDILVQRVFSRIVKHDRPGAVPIADYQRRFIGREATIEAVRRFSPRVATLAPSAFSAVDGWSDASALTLPACDSACTPTNSLWLAITRIERGEDATEVFVWYTTNFNAEHGPTGPQKAHYAFCERWVRVASGWKYEGFVRVRSANS